MTAPGLGPAFPTPVTPDAASMTGVQLQASVLDGLRSGAMIKPAGLFSRLAFTLSLLWLLLASLLVLPPRANLLLVVGLSSLAVALSAAFFWKGDLWLSPVAAVLGMAIVSLVWGWGQLGRVNDLLARELSRILPVAQTQPAEGFESDLVARQALSLGAAINRIEDLRRFSADALFSLPDATVVLDARRRVVAANAAAQTLLRGAPLAGALAAPLLNALEPLGRTFDESWPPEADRIEPIDLHLPDGRAYQSQTVFRRDEAGESAGWIVRLADITTLTAAMRQQIGRAHV
jgi:PAS domain-containing protein